MKRLLKIWLMVISFVSIIPWCLLSHIFSNEYLEGHNTARAEVGVKPLKWDKKLESLARGFVNEHIANCHGTSMLEYSDGIYGQNIGFNRFGHGSAASAVAYWVAQKRNYDSKSNKCIDGNAGSSCYTYVQVVWGKSSYLGCARGECYNNEGTLVTCYYYPGHNFPAQRPYPIH